MLKIGILLLLSLSASAKEVMSSYNFLANGLLPKGVYTFAYNSGKTSTINNRFDSSGNKISTNEWNSKLLSYQDLVNSSKNNMDKVLASSAFKAFDIDLRSSAAFVENELNVNSSSKVFVLGYGLTKKSNLFFIVPTVNVSFDIKSKFNASASYNKLIKDLRSSGQAQKASYLEKIQSHPLKARLNENGQKLPTEINSISNFYINYRRQFYNIISDTFAIIPYGYQYSTDDFLDFRLNDNSLGLKQGLGYDYNLSEQSLLGIYGSYHYRSPFKMDYRVPRTADDPMSSDIEKNVGIKYGDLIDLSGQYSYKWNSLFTSYVNLRYQHSLKDEYSGKAFSANRYEYLENETESKSVSAQVGISINTISSFIAKKFILPIDLNLQYSKVLYAKNSFDVDWLSFNLMVFYK